MGIALAPGFIANVQIRDLDNTILYQEPCHSKDKLESFFYKYGVSKEGWGLLPGLVMPLRTSSFKDFAKDLFLPTFVHYTNTIKNFALRIIASLFAFALDYFTLPLRLLATPLRFCYNMFYPEEKHPVMELIENNPDAQKALEDSVVNLTYEVHVVRVDEPPVPNDEEEMIVFQNASKVVTKGEHRVALKALPGGTEKLFSNQSSANTTFMKVDGEWISNSTIEGNSTKHSFGF